MRERVPGAREELLLSLRRLSDEELVARLKGLAARERRATSLVVAHLAELDTREVHLRAGYASLFTYCREVLFLSEDEAYNRIEAARAARRFPVVLDLLDEGEIRLTTIRLLGRHLTPENHRVVLEAARRKRKVEVEEIVARLAPRPDAPALIRKLPEHTPAGGAVSAVPERLLAPAFDFGAGAASPDCPAPLDPPAGPPRGAAGTPVPGPSALAVASAASPRRPADVTPLSPGRYRYQLTIGKATLEKLRLAKAMLRHSLPSGDDEAILDRALAALLRDLARKKFGAQAGSGDVVDAGLSGGRGKGTGEAADDGTGATADKDSGDPAREGDNDAAEETAIQGGARQCAGPDCRESEDRGGHSIGAGEGAGSDSRYVPVAVKRTVWLRDLGQCAFVSPDGRRCGERAFVEFHHLRPYAVGGEATVANIELRCKRHNAYEERVFFSKDDEGRERKRA